MIINKSDCLDNEQVLHYIISLKMVQSNHEWSKSYLLINFCCLSQLDNTLIYARFGYNTVIIAQFGLGCQYSF